MEYGFETALVVLAAWIKLRFDGVDDVLSDIEYATRLALRHLKRYHKATSPEIENVEKTLESINQPRYKRWAPKILGQGAEEGRSDH